MLSRRRDENKKRTWSGVNRRSSPLADENREGLFFLLDHANLKLLFFFGSFSPAMKKHQYIDLLLRQKRAVRAVNLNRE